MVDWFEALKSLKELQSLSTMKSGLHRQNRQDDVGVTPSHRDHDYAVDHSY